MTHNNMINFISKMFGGKLSSKLDGRLSDSHSGHSSHSSHSGKPSGNTSRNFSGKLCGSPSSKRSGASLLLLALVMLMLSCAQPSAVIEDLVTDQSLQNVTGSSSDDTAKRSLSGTDEETSPDLGTTEFEGALTYANNNVFQVPVNESRVFHPVSRITLDSADTRDESIIHYELVAVDEDALNPAPRINNSGVITINPNTTTGGPKAYKLRVMADEYITREVDLTLEITPQDANALRINVYHHGDNETSTIAVGLGQAIKDDSSSFSLSDSDEALKISNLTVGSDYALHFGESAGNYNRSTIFIADSTGSIVASKSELANLPNISGAALGISGHGINGIVFVAKYQPSNIYNHQDLQSIRHNLGGNYVLQKDIVFTVPSGATMSNFEAVGNNGRPFTGTFDGAGYSISNLQIYNPDVIRGKYQGLFGIIEAADATDLAVQNLELKDFRITGYAYVGSLAGWIQRGTVHAVAARVSGTETGKVVVDSNQGNHGYGGGLFGYAGTNTSGTQVTIQNSSSETKVTGSGHNTAFLGGLVGAGTRDMMITDSYATGDVTGRNDYVGGLIGANSGNVSGYATGYVNGSSFVGGLVGHNDYGTVSGYATGEVIGGRSVGGLVGEATGTVTGYATGNVSGFVFIGGLVGRVNIDSSTVSGYATGSVTGNVDVGGLVGFNGSGTVSGYATGLVIGNENFVGGLVGINDGTVTGYTRNVVRRTSDAINIYFAKVIGDEYGTSTIYSSEIENKIYDGITGTTELTGASGNNGTAIQVASATMQSDFIGFSFGTDIGQWTWVSNGRWPAINIGNEYPLSSARDQSTEPCIYAEDVDHCHELIADPVFQVKTYYSEEEIESPVVLGQAIKDSGAFALTDNTTVLSIYNLIANNVYTIHFGDDVSSYNANTTIDKTADENGIVTLSKSELANLPSRNGAVIGLSIMNRVGTFHVATYQPNNVYSSYDLQAMRVNLNGTYVLQNDIAFTTPSDAAESNFEAVGDNTNPFVGSLNGDNKKITGIQLYSTTGNYQGLFGVIEGSSPSTVVVRSLNLVDFNITGNAYVGSLAGWIQRGTVHAVAARVSGTDTGKVESSGTLRQANFAGGLVGHAGLNVADLQVTIQNSYSETMVIGSGGTSRYLGGLVGGGGGDSLLRDSYATGAVTGSDIVGGLIGFNAGEVSGGYATGGVTGSSSIGGLVGLNEGIVSGYATGEVTGTGVSIGGLVGVNQLGAITGYATGVVIGNSVVGGLVGRNYDIVIGYATGSVTGDRVVGGFAGHNYGTVYGYATGSVTGNIEVGGLVGVNQEIVTGYATGLVSGNDQVGALVGYNRDTVTGYARSVVRRVSGTSDAFGNMIGSDDAGTNTIYSSTFESKIYDGQTGTTEFAESRPGSRSGLDGASIWVISSTIQGDFNGLIFGTNLGQWTWVSDGRWPAINIGDAYPLSSATDQATEPCIYAENLDVCLNGLDVQVSTYYSVDALDLPVTLGPGIKDSGEFALQDQSVILTIDGLNANDGYTIHFGESDGSNEVRIPRSTDSNGTITISKSDAENLPPKEDAVIGISGSGIAGAILLVRYKPFNIYNTYDLQAMRLNLSGNYELQNDIEFTPLVDPNESNFEAVGDSTDPFAGTFDGAGYSIHNMQIHSTGDNQGLFGVIEAVAANDLVVENLELRDFNITGNANVGSVAGWIKRGTVDSVEGTVSAVNAGKVELTGNKSINGAYGGYGGGLFGRAGANTSGIQVTIQNSSSETQVFGIGDELYGIGGLVGGGSRDMIITDSYATGDVTGGNRVGGLVGFNQGTVSGYATGDVSGNENVGGFVGNNVDGTASGYATGSVTGSSFVGGLIGSNKGTVSGYATGEVSGNENVGGLVGNNIDGTASGYARGIVRRARGDEISFGKTIGGVEASSGTPSGTPNITYSSIEENKIYNGETGTRILSIGRLGNDGTAVRVFSSTTQEEFEDLSFGTDRGEWTWVSDGRWPAINIGDGYPLSAATDQATEPCIYADNQEICLQESTIQIQAYYNIEAKKTPVALGQGIKDSAIFAMPDSHIVLIVQGLVANNEYTIHFGDDTGNYNARNTIDSTTDSSGTITLYKLDVATLPSIDGAVIGISGSGISGIDHVAYYQPSKIFSTFDLQAMRLDLDEDYVLKKDIVFAIPKDATISNFETVGQSKFFTGTLDGAGKSITGIQIISTKSSFQGLFGNIVATDVDDLVVQNLELIDFKISADNHVGTVAGSILKGTVDNVNVRASSADSGIVEVLDSVGGGLFGRAGTVTMDTQVIIRNSSSEVNVQELAKNSNHIGGLVGSGYRSMTITDSYATGDVTGDHQVGGLLGSNYGIVSGYATGDVTASGGSAGGLIGNNFGTVTGYAIGDVEVSAHGAGGLVGSNDDKGTVRGYATGSVSGIFNIGGLVGDNDGTVSGYATGHVIGNGQTGGLVGTNDDKGTVTGYARGVVRRVIRPESGTYLNFGKTIGMENKSATSTTYSSIFENRIYDGEIGVTELTGRTGLDGTALSITNTTTERTFSGFTFGREAGDWTWGAGKWPAINIGIFGPAAPASAQPTDS